MASRNIRRTQHTHFLKSHPSQIQFDFSSNDATQTTGRGRPVGDENPNSWFENEFDRSCPRCGDTGFVFACGHRCHSCGFKIACDD